MQIWIPSFVKSRESL